MVNKLNPTIATTLSAGTVNIGATVHASATLSGATGNAGGTATYTVYSDNTCSTQDAAAGTKTVTNGGVPDSDPVTFSAAGTFYWQVVYSGDANNKRQFHAVRGDGHRRRHDDVHPVQPGRRDVLRHTRLQPDRRSQRQRHLRHETAPSSPPAKAPGAGRCTTAATRTTRPRPPPAASNNSPSRTASDTRPRGPLTVRGPLNHASRRFAAAVTGEWGRKPPAGPGSRAKRLWLDSSAESDAVEDTDNPADRARTRGSASAPGEP